MPYDEELADRIRLIFGATQGVSEKRMFGGLAFLVGGHMAITASGQGGVLVRCDPAHGDALVDATPAEVAVMRGRPMSGWLRVAARRWARTRNWPAGSTSGGPTRRRSHRRPLAAGAG